MSKTSSFFSQAVVLLKSPDDVREIFTNIPPLYRDLSQLQWTNELAYVSSPMT